MRATLTLIERYIIEAINRETKDIIQLHKETSIEIQILKKVLSRLLDKDLICFKDDGYAIKLVNLKKYSGNKKIEITNIMKEISSNSNQVSIKKVYLNTKENLRLKSMFDDIEKYIESRSSHSESVKKKTILYWGQQNYGELINNYLN